MRSGLVNGFLGAVALLLTGAGTAAAHDERSDHHRRHHHLYHHYHDRADAIGRSYETPYVRYRGHGHRDHVRGLRCNVGQAYQPWPAHWSTRSHWHAAPSYEQRRRHVFGAPGDFKHQWSRCR